MTPAQALQFSSWDPYSLQPDGKQGATLRVSSVPRQQKGGEVDQLEQRVNQPFPEAVAPPAETRERNDITLTLISGDKHSPGLPVGVLVSAWQQLRFLDVRSVNVVHAVPIGVTFPQSPAIGIRSQWLDDAMAELEEIDIYIESDDLPDVAERPRAEARRILEALGLQPIAPVVYPSEGDLVIHFKAPHAPASVLIEISDDGRGVCYAHFHGRSRRASYDSSADIPDAFVQAQLRELMDWK